MFEAIPKELKEQKSWVCAKNGSKCPMQAAAYIPASSTDPRTWSDYRTAEEAVRSGIYDYLGFVFTGSGIVGIDIDCGYDEHGCLTETAAEIITLCNTYCEVSRSGRGFHLLLRGSLPFSGRNNRKGLEIYQSQRYFIMTGRDAGFGGSFRENQEAIDKVLDYYFGVLPSARMQKTEQYYSGIYARPEGGSISLRPSYPVIGAGGRNNSLLSVAGAMWSVGYDTRTIFRELLRVNREACKPPLPRREIEQIVNSITKYRR